MNLEKLKNLIRNIPDFPKSGVQFKDITPILDNAEAFHYLISIFVEFAKKYQITAVLGPESRGFIFGAALAYELNVKFVPARKEGKLPYKTYQAKYKLEYGSSSLEIHQDALVKSDRVLIIDDLIATAGTIHAAIDLVNQASAQVVAIASLISLAEFKAQQNFGTIPLLNLIEF